MATFGQIMHGVGVLVFMGGLLIEFVAFAAMASYRLRRALPVKSPISLQSVGCACFCLGVVVAGIGRALM